MRRFGIVLSLCIAASSARPLDAQIDVDRVIATLDADLRTRVEQARRVGNDALAIDLVTTGAEGGSAEAQFALGAILTEWMGDHAAARVWFERSARQGHPDSYYGLGLMHGEGRGVPGDPVRAYTLFLAGARRDQRDAAFEVGSGFVVGVPDGVPDMAAGVYWLARARAGGHAQAGELIALVERQSREACEAARMLSDRSVADRNCWDWVEAELTRPASPSDCDGALLARGTARDRFRMVKGAEEGLTDCAYDLGMASIVSGASHRAHDWLHIAAAGSDGRAQEMLARRYAEGAFTGKTAEETRARARYWSDASVNRSGQPVPAEDLRRLGYEPLPTRGGTPPGPPVQRRLLAPPARTVAGADVILGLWDQYMVIDGRERRISRYRVTRTGPRYVMSLEWVAGGPGLIRARDIRDIHSDGSEWSFTSEWTDGRSGEFRLRRTGEDVYEGFVWVNGVRGTQNRWVKVGS